MNKRVVYQPPKYIAGGASASIVEEMFPEKSLTRLSAHTYFETPDLEVTGALSLYFEPASQDVLADAMAANFS